MTNDEEIAKKINSAIFPVLQGGPLVHVIAVVVMVAVLYLFFKYIPNNNK